MSGPISSGPIKASQINQADLLAHVRLLQDALDASAQTESSLVRAERQIAALQDQVERMSAQIVDGQRHCDAVEREMEALRASLSWRVTAPLRALRGMLARK
ncbi:hypothetical protein [Flavimaricola marinus]|uniref:Uncharacterized protein n=1 Tax=Flavimaricola marinus TaxID=1819565 RepID=A0A238LKC0_9RHOB|nr:hypothetical protein [Flavimaricola marinus]SMY09320.1 hypothetical protein LOM8899_03485 [Flavimaricola marinus]